MTETTGRVALVTGSSSGIGAATARLLAARGMRVVVNYLHSAAAAEQVVADIEAAGGQAMAVQADVREATAVDRLVEQVQATWGGIDVLVHNALTPYAVKSFQDTADEARAHYESFIAPYFTTDGQADLAVGASAIEAVAAELGVPAGVTAAEFYRTAAAETTAAAVSG